MKATAAAIAEATRRGLSLPKPKPLAEGHASQAWRSYAFRGAAQTLQSITDREFVIAGPSETGKTLACLVKIHRLCLQEHPRARVLIVRKTQKSIYDSVLVTFRKKVLGDRSGISIYGGEKPEWFDYPRGARIVVGGMDNADKLLSSEYDVIYANQAEELSEGDWETLGTRCTGRAGNAPFGLLFGDCNPAGAQHWIVQRSHSGKMQLFNSFHHDNPALWDEARGAWTDQGTKTLERLAALSGHRRRRLFEGQWASPEGVVFDEFDATLEGNLTADEPDPALPIELGCDDGYVDPRVFLFVQRTPQRILVFDELWHSRHLAERCVAEAVARCGERFGWADEDKTRPNRLPDIAVGPPEAKELQTRFRLANIPYRAAGGPNSILPGIEIVRRHLCDVAGARTLQVHTRCANLIAELSEGYVYPEGGNRKNNDQPVDANNHGADALRYWCQLRASR